MEAWTHKFETRLDQHSYKLNFKIFTQNNQKQQQTNSQTKCNRKKQTAITLALRIGGREERGSWRWPRQNNDNLFQNERSGVRVNILLFYLRVVISYLYMVPVYAYLHIWLDARGSHGCSPLPTSSLAEHRAHWLMRLAAQ